MGLSLLRTTTHQAGYSSSQKRLAVRPGKNCEEGYIMDVVTALEVVEENLDKYSTEQLKELVLMVLDELGRRDER
jgi:uncharacterized phage-associated protein